MKLTNILILLVLLSALGQFFSCQHSPILPDDGEMPIDTTEVPIDTTGNPGDTTMMTEPCDTNLVYFDAEILPILISNCAFSGCHDAASAEDGVILDSYENVIATADVEPFDIQNSEIWEVLTDDDEDERMPPPPTPRLDPDKIQLIAKWILQGAEDLECDPNADGCETENRSFAADVAPVLDTHCVGCHSGNPPQGGIDLSNYAGVKTVADDGRLFGAIAWAAGFSPMPQGGDQLPQCTIDQIKSWIDAGALDN
jgi:mono/diheme cytochrome c family protein